MLGEEVALPDPTTILPFLGLFSIVVLKPKQLVRCDICTKHLPVLSILQDNKFVRAPDGTSPADENVARIFDVLEVARDNPQISLGLIPLSPESAEFPQQRYWQLTLKPEVVLAALIPRIADGTFEVDEIGVAQAIYYTLGLRRLERLGLSVPGLGGPGGGGGSGRGGGSGGGGMSGQGAPGGGGGPSGESSVHKRNLRSTDRETAPKRSRTTEEGGLGKNCGLRSRPLDIAESEVSDNGCEQSSIKSHTFLTEFDK
jgi:hypothetical protein